MNALPLVLLFLTLLHGLVDAFAATIQPLWPDLQRGLRLDDGAIGWAFVLWNLATSVSQLVFGYWGDRYRGTWLLWVGPAVGVLCVSLIGLARSFESLGVLLLIGGLGIAAFHPEAAALAGSCAPGNRSRALSVFAVGGYLGQAFGPIYSGAITTRSGSLATLAWSPTWGLAVLLLLLLGLRRLPHPEAAKRAGPAVSLRTLFRGKEQAVGLILMIGTLRVLPAMGVPLALAFALKAKGETNTQVGIAQAVFMLGIGLGNLACAAFVHRERERRVLWMFPLLVAPCLLLCPVAGPWPLLIVLGVGGLLLGATMPILIGHGQELLRDGQRVASSLTMGVTWGLGGVLVAATMSLCNRAHRPELAFAVFALACVVSSGLCAGLARPEDHEAPLMAVAASIPDR